jgi:hypothetical protein
MTKRLSLRIAAVATVALVGSAFAQGADAPKSRADVKAETRAAEKAGKLVPAGEGPIAPTPSRQSNTTRAQRKADTLHARKAGELESTGEASDAKAERAEQARPSTTSRQQRKADTRAARQAGTLIPAGEGPGAPRK